MKYRDLDKEQRNGNYRKFHGRYTPTHSGGEKLQHGALPTLQHYIDELSKEEVKLDHGVEGSAHQEKIESMERKDPQDEEENRILEEEMIYKNLKQSEKARQKKAHQKKIEQEVLTEEEKMFRAMHHEKIKNVESVTKVGTPLVVKFTDQKKQPAKVETPKQKAANMITEQKAPNIITDVKSTDQDATGGSDLVTVTSQSLEANAPEKVRGPPAGSSKIMAEGPPAGSSKIDPDKWGAKAPDDVFNVADSVPTEASLDSYEKHLVNSHKKGSKGDSKNDIIELLKQYGKLKDEVTELTMDGEGSMLDFNGNKKSEPLVAGKRHARKNKNKNTVKVQ